MTVRGRAGSTSKLGLLAKAKGLLFQKVSKARLKRRAREPGTVESEVARRMHQSSGSPEHCSTNHQDGHPDLSSS